MFGKWRQNVMNDFEVRNQKIIDAIIEKANRDCPGSLALIGIYGSFATGDFYEKSDLDLLVLINDDAGWQLGCAFIQEDLGVGHDIYCTTWESLQENSLYNNPNISKLMHSKIVYCADDKYIDRLESLRQKVNDNLLKPFSKEDYTKAENLLKEAEHYYMMTMIAENMADVWVQAGNTIYYIENAIEMLNKKYFRFGTKRVYEELEFMEHKPENLCEMIDCVLSANSMEQVKKHLSVLIQETARVFKKVAQTIFVQKNPVTADSIRGTYEEMISNWRNKLFAAAKEENKHLAFMSMISLNTMISEIGAEVEIADYDVLGDYNPRDLKGTAQACDNVMKEYLKEYEKVNLQLKQYQDIDGFVRQYLEQDF